MYGTLYWLELSMSGTPVFSSLVMMLLAAGIAGEQVSGMDPVKTNESDLERSVCGSLREPLAFWSFRLAAGTPDAKRLRAVPGVERLLFTTRDDRRLGGYKLHAIAPWGYLLVAQGNAMLADQIIGQFQLFRDLGLDVYIYDYRGYGLSEGKSRLKALVSDYQQIIGALNSQDYRRRFLYGISMGGIILLDAVGRTADYDALVIDSSPSRISPLGCPPRYDPVEHLPLDCSRIQLIIGLRDRVVPPCRCRRAGAKGTEPWGRGVATS